MAKRFPVENAVLNRSDIKNNMQETQDKRQRFIKLSWEILEHKCRYYIMDKPIIQDYEYDAIEKEYDALAKELGAEPTASDMVGFNLDRPSCQSVMRKLGVLKIKKAKKKRK